jgi:hypothetical protein
VVANHEGRTLRQVVFAALISYCNGQVPALEQVERKQSARDNWPFGASPAELC